MTKITYESITEPFRKAFEGKTLPLKDEDGNILGTATITGMKCALSFNDADESKKAQETIEEK
jgi:hypothetical protein